MRNPGYFRLYRQKLHMRVCICKRTSTEILAACCGNFTSTCRKTRLPKQLRRFNFGLRILAKSSSPRIKLSNQTISFVFAHIAGKPPHC
mmetsp:Transcript_35999/g.66963  ORF Transcript_35999/g.66963 Transcript_35999/m.66963 type:complete len:89 (+) Transcript_35999:17-283(+)